MRKWIAAAVIVVILAGVGWFAYDQKNTLALVNREKITKQDVDKILAQFALLNPTYDKTNQDNINQALEMVANDRVLLQEAKKRSITVPQDELKGRVDELRQWLQDYVLTAAAQDVKDLNPDDAKLTGVDKAAADAERKRIEEALKTTSAALLDKKLADQKITFADIAGYIESQVVIEKLVDALAAQTKVTDEQIKQYYDMNAGSKFTSLTASHILVSKEDLANEILGKLKGGADFKALSDQYNEDETAKQDGGSVGTFYPGDMDPTFEMAAFALANPGDLSSVVKTDFGYHVIRLDGRQVASFDEVKGYVTEQLQNEGISKTLQGLATNASIKPQWLKDKLLEPSTNPQ
ncbi:MAG: peptidylprolyl isomerase [Bacillota bacterium]